MTRFGYFAIFMLVLGCVGLGVQLCLMVLNHPYANIGLQSFCFGIIFYSIQFLVGEFKKTHAG